MIDVKRVFTVVAVVALLSSCSTAEAETTDEARPTPSVAKVAACEAELDAWADSVTATLDQTAGNLTEQTRESVALRAVDLGFADIARDIGVPTSDIVNAMLGQTEAIYRVRSAVDDYTMGLEGLSRADYDAAVTPLVEMLAFMSATLTAVKQGGWHIREGARAPDGLLNDWSAACEGLVGPRSQIRP